MWGCEDYGITVDGIHYVVLIDEENVKYITIISYTGSSTNVVIPSSINVNGEDIPVKVITNDAFKDNDTITSVTISDSITTIGEFSGCSSLTSIYIPDSVTRINYRVFYNCSNLITVTISEGSQLTSIASEAFYNCDSLTSIFIPNSVTTIGNYAFGNCSNLTIYCEASSKPSGWYSSSYSSWNSSNRPVVWNSYLGIHDTLDGLEYAVCIDNEGNPYIVITGYNGSNTDVVIPEYIEVNGEQIVVKEISNSAFFLNAQITSIYIPDSVTTIGEYAFYECSKLTIYCKVPSKPSGWDDNWNSSWNNYSNRPVVWNCTYEEYLDEIA